MVHFKLLLITMALIGFSCNNEIKEKSNDLTEDSQAEALTDISSTPPKEWVEQRVASAQNRLSATRSGRLLWRSIETHGGLSRWFSNGPLYFRFNYQNPLGMADIFIRKIERKSK